MVFLLLFVFELIVLFVLSQFLTRCLSTLFYKITKSQTITIHLLSILFLPGVIIHELSHFLAAGLLFVRVGEIEFFPKITQDGVKLGSVQIAKTDFLRRAVIGFAPVLGGVSLILVLLYYFFQDPTGAHSYWKIAFIIYALFEVGNTMFSSRKDIEGTLELIITLFVLGVLLFAGNIRAPFYLLGNAIGLQSLFFRNASLLLLVPLGIDGIICAGFWFSGKKWYVHIDCIY